MLRPRRRRALVAALLATLVLAAPASSAVDGWIEATGRPFVLTMPAFGEVTSGFGPRWGRMHYGIDIGSLTKRGVVAAYGGTVTETGWLPGYGGYGIVIVIDHGNGHETLYSHLARVRVEPGQQVKAGDWIGTAGCTGLCYGMHLHFELRVEGTPVDPMPFFARP
jgi:murein DD-endopeptidase MepM/ murein hydrolase activator NlpD